MKVDRFLMAQARARRFPARLTNADLAALIEQAVAATPQSMAQRHTLEQLGGFGDATQRADRGGSAGCA